MAKRLEGLAEELRACVEQGPSPVMADRLLLHLAAAASQMYSDPSDAESLSAFIDNLKTLATKDKATLAAALRKHASKGAKALSKRALAREAVAEAKAKAPKAAKIKLDPKQLNWLAAFFTASNVGTMGRPFSAGGDVLDHVKRYVSLAIDNHNQAEISLKPEYKSFVKSVKGDPAYWISQFEAKFGPGSAAALSAAKYDPSFD